LIETKSCFVTYFVWYLIATNIYSYFYYHIWTDDAQNTKEYDFDRMRRRFVNLILAIMFSAFSFAFLYRFPYYSEFVWNSEMIAGNAIWFSISNSLAANYEVVKSQTEFGNTLTMIQLILTFIFITIIISRSIPQKN
jgi:hypothetical protein